MRGAREALSLMLVAGLCLTGCQTLRNVGSGGGSESTVSEEGYTVGLVPAAQLNIMDVPYPDAFKLDRNESFFFQDAFLEWGVLVYRGGDDIQEVYEFYKNEMPQHGWTAVNAVHQYGIVIVNFQKEQKKCTVFLQRKVRSTVIQVSVFPGPPMTTFR